MGNSDDTSGFQATSISDFDHIIATARKTYRSGRSRDMAWRKQQLRALYRLVDENKDAICAAAAKDFGKPRHEAMLAEVLLNLNHIAFTLEHIDEWSKPDYPEKGVTETGADLSVRKEPFGVCLIIAPWNYPFDLIFKPLTSALAAGNTCLCKPSEITPHCAMTMARLFPKYLDKEAVFVVNGGIKETAALLEKKFDHICYTGSTAVGRIIMAAAAKHLTPVVLELGGKSPVVIDPALTPEELKRAAQRIINTKLMNNGQTCIAPDYVLCPAKHVPALAATMKEYITKTFGPDASKSPHLAKVVNKNHTRRLGQILDQQKSTPGTIVITGGNWDESKSYVEPTVLVGVKGDGPVMAGEIFGPILPIIECNSIDAAIDFINDRDRPLALYVFSSNPKVSEKVHTQAISGGVCINDCMFHAAPDSATFGGVGPSGMGCLHGKYGFLSYCHQKTVVAKKVNWFSEKMNELTSRYPPYTNKATDQMLGMATKKLPAEPTLVGQVLKYGILLAAAGAGFALFSGKLHR